MPKSMGWTVIWLPLLMGILVCRPGEEHPPHVVIVSVDTLNRNALRSFAASARPLPVLDAFAEENIRFLNAYSTASWTLPAHASLLTGLYPDRHGANKDTRALGIGVGTVAEALRSRGYQTVAFTGGGFLNARYGFSRGFDRYDEHLGEEAEAAAIGLPREGAPPPGGSEDLFARAIAFVSQRPSDAGPLFLFLHTYSVHDYYKLREWALARLQGPRRGRGLAVPGLSPGVVGTAPRRTGTGSKRSIAPSWSISTPGSGDSSPHSSARSCGIEASSSFSPITERDSMSNTDAFTTEGGSTRTSSTSHWSFASQARRRVTRRPRSRWWI